MRALVLVALLVWLAAWVGLGFYTAGRVVVPAPEPVPSPSPQVEKRRPLDLCPERPWVCVPTQV